MNPIQAQPHSTEQRSAACTAGPSAVLSGSAGTFKCSAASFADAVSNAAIVERQNGQQGSASPPRAHSRYAHFTHRPCPQPPTDTCDINNIVLDTISCTAQVHVCQFHRPQHEKRVPANSRGCNVHHVPRASQLCCTDLLHTGSGLVRTSTPASMQMAQPSASPAVPAAPHSHALAAASCAGRNHTGVKPDRLSHVALCSR